MFAKQIESRGISQQGFKTATENKIIFYSNYTEMSFAKFIY